MIHGGRGERATAGRRERGWSSMAFTRSRRAQGRARRSRCPSQGPAPAAPAGRCRRSAGGETARPGSPGGASVVGGGTGARTVPPGPPKFARVPRCTLSEMKRKALVLVLALGLLSACGGNARRPVVESDGGLNAETRTPTAATSPANPTATASETEVATATASARPAPVQRVLSVGNSVPIPEGALLAGC